MLINDRIFYKINYNFVFIIILKPLTIRLANITTYVNRVVCEEEDDGGPTEEEEGHRSVGREEGFGEACSLDRRKRGKEEACSLRSRKKGGACSLRSEEEAFSLRWEKEAYSLWGSFAR